jgi:N-formylglutamate amidohydrolase
MPTGYDDDLNPPFDLIEPAQQRVPFVFNSPHSGRNYRPQFLAVSRLDRWTIRKSEDFRVDELFMGAASLGAPLLAANFPRAYLDVNREPYELDPAMFEEGLPQHVNTRSARVAGGLGTIAKIVSETEEIYARRLSVDDALERIETLYRPYHSALRGLMLRTHASFGHAVLVDCHSMPSAQERNAPRKPRPDFVIGDRFGLSCAPQITWSAAEILADLGYAVEINKPYAGGYITEHYGRPDSGFHAIQIEINRALYMDEATLAKRHCFDRIAHDMTRFIARLIAIPETGLAGRHSLAAE